MNNLNKGVSKAEVTLKWDPSPLGAAAHDLDLIAGVFTSGDSHGTPAYLVYFGSRSPDGTITLNRDSKDGVGLGTDEDMTLELDRLSDAYTRVVVGVAIQQRYGERTFGEIAHAAVRVLEGYTELAAYDFSDVANATAATFAEFTREIGGVWQFRPVLHAFDDIDPQSFARLMGRV